jgi:hypothetical protein
MVQAAGALGVLTVVVGCTVASNNMNDVNAAPSDAGVPADFDTTYDHLTAATLKGLARLKLQLTSAREDWSGTYFTVTKPPGDISYGAMARIYIRKSSAPPTTLSVVWLPRVRMLGLGGETSQADFIHQLYGAIVGVQPNDNRYYINTGHGRVMAVEGVTTTTNETMSGRIGQGVLYGGPIGGAMASRIADGTEEQFGTATLFKYRILLPDRPMFSVDSFSAVNAGDCVSLTKLIGKTEWVLERTESRVCGPG